MNHAFHDIEAPRCPAAYRDPRADGGERDVTLTARHVTIGRRLRGVRMKICVPTDAYRGLVLALQKTTSGRVFYTVALRHADEDLDVPLEETYDETEAVGLWRAWGQRLGVPLHVAGPDGRLQRFTPPDRPEPVRRRAEGVATLRSRGRFQRRRAVGHEASPGPVHKGEREIICYE